MKSTVTIIGLILILVGVVFLAYQGITYTSKENVLRLGDMQVTADTQKTIVFPPLLGGLSLAAGIVLVIVGRMGRPK